MGGTCSCLGLEAALAALSDDVGYSSPGGRPSQSHLGIARSALNLVNGAGAASVA